MWILLLSPFLFAQNIMVKAPYADIYAYQVFAENSDNLRPSQLELPCSEASILKQYSQTANDNFVNGSLETAKNYFLKIGNLKWKCDWKPKERQIIVEALFRLSQLEAAPSSQIEHIKTAIEFDEDLNMDDKLFPPPLIEIYQHQKAKSKTSALNKYYDTYSVVLRNGRPLKVSKDSLTVPSGKARYTFLSDSHAPISAVSDPHNLDIQSAPLVSGDCSSFILNTPEQWSQSVKVFFGPECLVDQPKNSLALATSEIALKEELKNNIDHQLDADNRNKKPHWIERNYLWIGAAIVATVLISSEMNQRKDTQTVIRPTNTRQGN